jgi:hypothetical protein
MLMAEPDEDLQLRFYGIAALCGGLGVASGYAIFLNYDEISGKPWRSLAALMVAALVSYFIEWLRDLIRQGEVENETHPIVRSMGAFVVALLFELFISGFHGGFEMGAREFVGVANSLLGADAAGVQGIRGTVVAASLMWILVGALVACWLTLMVGRDDDKSMAVRVGSSAAWGTMGGLLLAPIVIGLYIVVGRAVVSLEKAVELAPTVSAGYQDSSGGVLGWVPAPFRFPLTILRAAAEHGLVVFWSCYLGLCVVLGVVLWWRRRTKESSGKFVFFLMSLCLAYSILTPFAQGMESVVKQMVQQGTYRDVGAAVLLGAVVWGIPGCLLGGLVPLLRRAWWG